MKSKRNKISNLLKLGILLFGISLLLYNCQKEDYSDNTKASRRNAFLETASLDEIRSSYIEKQILGKGTNPVIITPDWSTLTQRQLPYADAMVTQVDVKINREGNFTNKLLYIMVNGVMKTSLYTLYAHEVNPDGTYKLARMMITDLNGNFISGYGFKDGKATVRFIAKTRKNSNKSTTLTTKKQSKMFAYQYPTDFWGGTGGDGGPADDYDGGGGGTDDLKDCTDAEVAAGKCTKLDEIEIPDPDRYEHDALDPDAIWDSNGNPIDDYTDGTPTDETTDDSTGGGGTSDNDTVDVGVIVIVNDTNDGANNCKDGQTVVDGKCVYITKDTPCTQEGYVRNTDLKCVPAADPCKEIKDQIGNTNNKAIKEELEKLTSEKEETGYVENKIGTFTKLPSIKNGHSLSLAGINYKNIYGFTHTHLNNFLTGKIDKKTGLPIENIIYRMFSPADVIALLNIAKNSTDLSKVYATIITSTGNYTLKFTGSKLDIFGLKTAIAYKKDYLKSMKKGKEKGFLQFLKNHIKVKGIELYKLHKPLLSSTIKIQRKSLDSNGKVDKTECE